ncbi:hypothetical protein NL676_015382 [Syzygium grande]|nr:hypothetical protein NL676_015382 [Syzygium grande]
MQILLLGRLGMHFMNGLGLMLDHYEARPKPGPGPVHRYQRIVIANDLDRSFNVKFLTGDCARAGECPGTRRQERTWINMFA